jgi:uncharacterized protein (TIGR00725 family)
MDENRAQPWNQRPVIGVMGGADVSPEEYTRAQELGRLIAERGWILLTGGRDCGVMRAACEGAKSVLDSFTVGILPGRNRADANPFVDLAIATGLGDGRNVLNILNSDVVIACAGGAGTLSEVALAVKNRRPLVLLGFAEDTRLDRMLPGAFTRAATPEEAVKKVASFLGE